MSNRSTPATVLYLAHSHIDSQVQICCFRDVCLLVTK